MIIKCPRCECDFEIDQSHIKRKINEIENSYIEEMSKHDNIVSEKDTLLIEHKKTYDLISQQNKDLKKELKKIKEVMVQVDYYLINHDDISAKNRNLFNTFQQLYK